MIGNRSPVVRAVRQVYLAVCLGALVVLMGCAEAPPPKRSDAGQATGAFAFRDPRTGAPASPALTPKEERRLASGLAALDSGNPAAAEKSFRNGGNGGDVEPPTALRLALAYVALHRDDRETARQELQALLSSHPDYTAALEANADLDALEGSLREAASGYRKALSRLPGDRRLESRLAEVRGKLVAERRAEAEKALASGELETARRLALSLLDLEPSSPAGYQILARAAEGNGKLEDAYSWAVRARAIDASDPAWTEVVANLAAQTHRWADAIALYDQLAARDATFREKADEARVEFRLQNLPELSQKAVLSPRVTRAQFAVLLSAFVPEVRDSPVPPLAEIAVDAVDRADRAQLLRAVALGFFDISRDSHRIGAEAFVHRSEMPALLKRLHAVVAAGSLRVRTPACLKGENPAALSDCGILPEGNSKNVTGRETVVALERTARLGRGEKAR